MKMLWLAKDVTIYQLIVLNSPYLGWDYGDPEPSTFGVALHTFEWMLVRLAPIVFIGTVVGII